MLLPLHYRAHVFQLLVSFLIKFEAVYGSNYATEAIIQTLGGNVIRVGRKKLNHENIFNLVYIDINWETERV